MTLTWCQQQVSCSINRQDGIGLCSSPHKHMPTHRIHPPPQTPEMISSSWNSMAR